MTSVPVSALVALAAILVIDLGVTGGRSEDALHVAALTLVLLVLVSLLSGERGDESGERG